MTAESRQGKAFYLFSSSDLFIAGLLAMPSFLFNPSLPFRVAQFFLFWLYVLAVGKKNSVVATLSVSAGIIAFNLIVPYGRVLLSWGAFRITEGSMLGGIQKAVTVEGLILLSRATIRSDLRLPGSFGSLISESFRCFDLILEKKGMIDRKDIVGSIDALLLELSDRTGKPFPEGVASGNASISASEAATAAGAAGNPAIARGPARHRAGSFVLVAALCLSWALFAAALFARL